MAEQTTLNMTLAELLNTARRNDGAAMVEVPPAILAGDRPPALIVAVTGEKIGDLKELVMRRFELGDGEDGRGKGLIIAP